MTKSKGIIGPRMPWTDEDNAILCARYPHERTSVVAEALGRRLAQVYQHAAKMRLSKSPEFLASPASGRTNGRQGAGTRFTKGIIPWNKGTHFDSGGRSVETRFKPGKMPHNTLSIGSYRVDKDGTLQRKVSEAKGNNSKRWRGVHELVWIAQHGPVPPKHIVVFKSGKRTAILEEITLDSVECIGLAENMKRNTRHNYPKELSDLMQLRGAITRQINKRLKNEQ
ncbi:MAG: endonuclease [Herbaspirillum sp.]|nr:endonuclease [Herbaspirillum sp.]